MEKVHPWRGQPSDRGRLQNITDTPYVDASPKLSFSN